MAIAVPHQDVLIIADIKNNTGYDVLAQIAMKFFTEVRIPITSLALMYENTKLNEKFISEMEAKCEGEMAIAVPHQEVLIIADIKNNTVYDVLAQIAMKFFAEGRIPITSLALMYEDKKLEPIFILAKNKPTK